MPASLDTTDPAHLVLVLSGELSLDEVDKAIPALAAELPARGQKNVLVDAQQVTQPLTVSELAFVASHLGPLVTAGVRRIAIVAPDARVQEQSRVFASFATVANVPVKVFADLPAAAAWLAGR